MKDFIGIKLKGRCFNESERLDFFQRKKEKPLPDEDPFEYTQQAIVYGSNGSGKSTIARAFQEMESDYHTSGTVSNIGAHQVVPIKPNFDDKTLLYKHGRDAKCGRVFVFNESYVNENINVSTKTLKCIVMLGKEQIDESKRIEEYEKILKEKYEKAAVLDVEINGDEKKHGLLKEATTAADAREAILRLDSGWAERDSIIKDLGKERHSRNANVNGDTVAAILNLDFKLDNIGTLKEAFRADAEHLGKMIKKKGNLFPLFASRNMGIETLVTKVRASLKKTISQPSYQSEAGIETGLITGNPKFYEEVKARLGNSEIHMCPYCFQSLSDIQKNKIIVLIKEALNHDYEDYLRELNKLIDELDNRKTKFSFSQYAGWFSDEIKIVQVLEKSYNNGLEDVKGVINKRIANPFCSNNEFQSSSDTIDSLNRICTELIDAIVELNKRIDEHNGELSKIDEGKVLLSRFNRTIARLEINEQHLLCVEKEKRLADAQMRLQHLKTEISDIETLIKKFKAQLRSSSIAADIINKYISYVFTSKNRLSLEYEDDAYSVKSNGIPLDFANQLSQGERNIIALAFFFAKVNAEKRHDDFFNEPALFVLDDPISSVDHFNKLGLFSFFCQIFRQILEKNKDSKILIFTHSLDVASNFEKISKAYLQDKTEYIGHPFSYQILGHKLSLINFEKYNEYTVSLRAIYDYAKTPNGDASEPPIGIGNIIRRVIEGYLTFNYKEGMGAMNSRLVLSLLSSEDESFRNYFSSRMSRLLLNSFSHMQDAVKMGGDVYTPFTPLELHQSARDVLLFLFTLDKVHIHSHLGYGRLIEETLNRWRHDILTRDAS